MARVVYQYRLTDTVEYEALQLAGVSLTKGWTTFTGVKEELTPFLKSTTKPEGMVDYQKVNADSNEVLYKTIPIPMDIPIFDKSVLFTMTRSELCEICKEYGIVTVNRTNQFLVKEILEKQEKTHIAPIVEEVKVIIDPSDTNIIETDPEIVKDETKKTIFDILKKK